MANLLHITSESKITHFIGLDELMPYLTDVQFKVLGLIMNFTKRGEKCCTLTTEFLKGMGIEDNGNTTQAINALCSIGIISKKIEMDKKLGKVVRHFYYHGDDIYIDLDELKKLTSKKKKTTKSKKQSSEHSAESAEHRSAESAEHQSALSAEHRSAESAECFDDRSAESAETVPQKVRITSALSAERSLYINNNKLEYIVVDGEESPTTPPSNDKKFEENNLDFSDDSEEQKISSGDQKSSPEIKKSAPEDKPKTLEDLVKSKEPYKSTHADNQTKMDFPRSAEMAAQPTCMEEICEFCKSVIKDSQAQMFNPVLDKIDPEDLAGKFWRRGNVTKWSKSHGLKITNWRSEFLVWIEREKTYIINHPEKFEKKSKKSEVPEIDKDILDEIANIGRGRSYGS